jgi:hypothetical protein
LVVNWVSSCLSFFLSASTAATYIFIAPTSKTTIIPLESCTLNAGFQHLILRFNQISLLCRYHWRRGKGLKAGPKPGWREGDFLDNSTILTWFWGGFFSLNNATLNDFFGSHYILLYNSCQFYLLSCCIKSIWL